MTKDEIIVQALNDHIYCWFNDGINMKYIAALAKEANYSKDVMFYFAMQDGLIFPKEFLDDDYLNLSRGEQIDLITEYLKQF